MATGDILGSQRIDLTQLQGELHTRLSLLQQERSALIAAAQELQANINAYNGAIEEVQRLLLLVAPEGKQNAD